MAELEKTKRKKKSATEMQESKLYREALSKKPCFSSNDDAVAAANRDLEAIAKKHDKTVESFLVEAESSAKFDEDHLEALTLARRIARLSK